MKKINYVDNNITWGKMIDYVRFVVENSFDDNGKYHSFRRDYFEAVVLLKMYSDYGTNENEEYSFDEVMEFRHSQKWGLFINSIDNYAAFDQYIEDEIQRIIAPFTSVDQIMVEGANLLKSMNNVIKMFAENLDMEQIKNIDFSKLASVIEAYDNLEKASVSNENKDNIVDFNNKNE